MEFHWSMRYEHIWEVILDTDQTAMWGDHRRHLILEALSVEIGDSPAYVLRVRNWRRRLIVKLLVQPEQFLIGLPVVLVEHLTDTGAFWARELAWRYECSDEETKEAFRHWGQSGDPEALPPDEHVPSGDLVRRWTEDLFEREVEEEIKSTILSFTGALLDWKLEGGGAEWSQGLRRDPEYGWALQRNKLGMIRTVAVKHASRAWPDMDGAPFRVRATLGTLGEPEITW